jgi:hypothetical protein
LNEGRAEGNIECRPLIDGLSCWWGRAGQVLPVGLEKGKIDRLAGLGE